MTPEELVRLHVQANVTGLIAALVDYSDPEACTLMHGDEESGEEVYSAMEVWYVTPWLADRLQRQNHRVAQWWNGHYWARGGTGQAIWMDPVIGTIAREVTPVPVKRAPSRRPAPRRAQPSRSTRA